MPDQEAFVIRNEDDLFQLLERVTNDDAGAIGPEDVRFDGFPHLKIVLQGEDFNGGIPTRIMPGLLALQKSIDQAYALTAIGEPRPLTKEERKKTEVVVYIHKGSSEFVAKLWDTFNIMLKTATANMTGAQALAAILGFAAIAGLSFYMRAQLSAKAAAKELETKLLLTQEETKRFQMVADLARQNGALHAAKEALEDANAKFINRLEGEDKIMFDNGSSLDGQMARKIVRNTPEEPVEARMDGLYRILSVQSGAVRSGYKVQVEPADGGEPVMVDIPDGTLTEEQVLSLQRGEWEKEPLYMEINVRRRGEKVLKATLSFAGLRT
ncbi:hypothetical protein [Pannonibacter sp.]|uniref:hypothetical protein n=1 Tax=Pannonibacter sp. TaxID=1906786 RepID=UPI003F711A59